jgi:hypothetical protein
MIHDTLAVHVPRGTARRRVTHAGAGTNLFTKLIDETSLRRAV